MSRMRITGSKKPEFDDLDARTTGLARKADMAHGRALRDILTSILIARRFPTRPEKN